MMCICGGAGKIYAEREILLCFDEGFPMGVIHTGFPYRQETAGERFPMGVMHTGFPYRQETMGEGFPAAVIRTWLPLPTGNCWRKVSCCGDALWSAIPTGNFTPERFDSGSLSFSTLRRQQKSLSAGKPTGFWREGRLLSRKSKVKMIRINAPPFLRLAAVFPFIMGI